MKKVFYVFIILACFFMVGKVDAAENKILVKDWDYDHGYTTREAINWTNTLEVSDGYLITTIDEDGYGLLTKVSKDGKECLWEQYNPYGAFFGGILLYNDNILILSYDYGSGVVLIEYSPEGEFLRQKKIRSSKNNSYVYAGEMYIRDDKLYYIHKSLKSTVDSDTNAGPQDLITFDLKTFTKESMVDYSEVPKEKIDYITGNLTDVVSEQLNSIYKESGYETFIYQQIYGLDAKYYIGFIYNDTNQYGIVVKTDLQNNTKYVSKSKENHTVYYDASFLENGYLAVSGYKYGSDHYNPDYRRQYNYPRDYYSEINLFDSKGNIIEKHDINSELNVSFSDITSLKHYGNAVIAQVVAIEDDELVSYTIKYDSRKLNISKYISGAGDVKVISQANLGDLIELEVTPEEGNLLKSLRVTDAYGNNVNLDGYKFVMPDSDAKVYAEFVPVLKENPKTGISTYIVEIIAIISILGIVLHKSNKFSKFKKIN